MSARTPAITCLASAAALLAGCGSSDKAGLSAVTKEDRPFEVQGDVGAMKVEKGAAQAGATVALMPDGLLISQATKGSAVTLAKFGDAQDTVIAGLSRTLGKPAESDNAECSAGKMHFADFGSIKANFVDGKFVGWFAERGKGLRTGDGVSPDWSWRQLQRVGATKVAGSTLDGEFMLDGSGREGGGMGGFADSGDNVRSLYGGVNCFFR